MIGDKFLKTVLMLCVGTASLLEFLNAKREPGNRNVEEKYKELYPDLDNTDSWPEIKNFTANYLKQLCSHVVVNMTGSLTTEDRLVYKYPENKTLPEDRLIKNATIKFPDCVKFTTLLKCAYYVRDFYVARGGQESVFRLDKDRQQDLYYLESGLHPVKYYKILNTTHYILEPIPRTFQL